MIQRTVQYTRYASPFGRRRVSPIGRHQNFLYRPANSVLFLPGLPGSGATITDFSGSGNNGALAGATWARLPSGLWGLSFDGTDNYVDCGSNSSLAFTSGNFSFITWVYPVVVDDTYMVACKGKANLDGWEAWYDINGRWNVRTNQAAASQVSYAVTNGVVAGKWQMISFARGLTAVGNPDSTAIVTYINGAQSQEQIAAHTNPAASARNMYLSIWDDEISYGLNGKQALPRVFSLALTASKMATIYQQERHLFGV